MPFAQAMWELARWYTQFGLMAGTVFREVLADLRAEQLHDEADAVQGAIMAPLCESRNASHACSTLCIWAAAPPPSTPHFLLTHDVQAMHAALSASLPPSLGSTL